MIQTSFTVADFFCGAGGLSLGLEAAGFKVLCAFDWEKAAVETHRTNLGDRVAQRDLFELVETPLVDLVAGGPPCQGFSSAGMRKSSDDRNSLVSCFAKQIRAVRPAAFVFENVEGFLTAEDGKHIFELLEPLISEGYRIHLRKVNAANFGVPQHRKRVLAIGGLGWDPTFPEATHTAFGAPGAGLAARHLPLTQTVEEALSTLPAASPRPPGAVQGHCFKPLEGLDLERALALKPGETMRDLPEDLHHESYRRRAFRRVMDGTPTERRGGAPAGVRRLRADEPSKAITGGARSEFLHPSEHRSLTIRECASLQTFPTGFVFVGTPSEQGQLIGNAVPPLLAKAIGDALLRDLKSCARAAQKPGTLLSFVPTLSEGASPVLRRVSNRVRDMFQRSSMPEQELLWR